MAFAFSNKQFEEGLKKLGAWLGSVVAVGGGGFIRKSDTEKLNNLLLNHEERMNNFLKEDCNMIDALAYELGNHEYTYTWDDSDALRALGLDRENEQVARCLKAAKEKINLEED